MCTSKIKYPDCLFYSSNIRSIAYCYLVQCYQISQISNMGLIGECENVRLVWSRNAVAALSSGRTRLHRPTKSVIN